MTPPQRSPRLAVEQRLVAAVAIAGLVQLLSVGIWVALALEPEQLGRVLAPTTLGPLLATMLGASVAASLHVAARLPAVRWPRPTSEASPSPWPLALIGAPSLLVWPLLRARDRRASAREHDPQEVELGFRELLAVPRVAATKLGSWLAVATLLAAALVAEATAIDAGTLALTTGLSLASLASLVSLTASRLRTMLIPEYLAAPRPEPLALPVRRSLALRLGGPASLALVAAVVVPTLAGILWSERIDTDERRAQAQREAARLAAWLDAGELDRVRAFIVANPEHGVELGSAPLGHLPEAIGPRPGFIDSDGDGVVDHWVTETELGALVSAPVPPPAAHHPSLFACAVVLGLTAGLAALVLLLRDLERDVDRASRQVSAVTDGEIPEPMAVDTFATAELRALVSAIDRLVGRITDANVAKYVLIEKGHEADRLKSQFLANMSHDLRSPLNSVLGFSDLLLTGIEGELASAQRERVAGIHRTGKALLQQIDDILDTAKLEAGRMDLHQEPTPPATLIARAVQRARVRLSLVAEPTINFDTTFAPGIPPAFVDPYRTVQAIENVLAFAAEGIDEGTVTIVCDAPSSAHAKPGATQRDVVIRIISPRASVPLAQLEQARRGFFRLPGHTGLGLSLPIATSILELQGGALIIEDGSTPRLAGRAALVFELRLPALTPRRVPRPRIVAG